MIQNKEVLEQIREEAVKELNSYDCRILVCSGTGCVATGSQKIYEKFMEIAKDAPGVTIEFGPHDKDAHIGVKKTGCQGVCELGPLVRIQKGDDVIQYTKVQIEAVTPEWIKERTGKSVDDIFWILKYVCEQVKINTRKENWNSYDSMNKRIIDELDKD